MFRFLRAAADEEQLEPASDIKASYHDMAQTGRRAEKLLAEIEQTGRNMEELAKVIAQKTDLLCSGNGNEVQLEREIDSAVWRLSELKKQKADMETAAACCSMYGMFGLDYSISASKLYYKGKSVKYFLDDECAEADKGSYRFIYQNPEGEVSVTAKRGRFGGVIYLKVFDHVE